jgi:hypothetical protein
MKKNIVVMPAFCDGPLPHYAQMCVKFWTHWCKQNNIEFYVITDKLYSFEDVPPHIQKLYVFDLIENSKIEFNQCLVADWDTFPMPNAKNIFEYTNDKFSICLDYGWATGLIKSINFVAKYFDHTNVTWDNYFNSGFYIFNKSHKHLFKEAIEFFKTNREELKLYNELFISDQTPFNYIVHRNTDTTILPRSFMVHDYFLDIFLNNYTDHNGVYVDSQSYMTNINFVHMTRDANFRNNLVDLIQTRFYNH